jgi:hypothetical protein
MTSLRHVIVANLTPTTTTNTILPSAQLLVGLAPSRLSELLAFVHCSRSNDDISSLFVQGLSSMLTDSKLSDMLLRQFYGTVFALTLVTGESSWWCLANFLEIQLRLRLV